MSLDGDGRNEDNGKSPESSFLKLSPTGSIASIGGDTDSTASTEVDSSFSKNSISSCEEDYEEYVYNTPPRNRHAVFRRIRGRYADGDSFSEEEEEQDGHHVGFSLFDSDQVVHGATTNTTKPAKKLQAPSTRKRYFRMIFMRYYTLLAFATCCSLIAIQHSTLNLTTSKELDSWKRFLQEDAILITREIKRLPTPETFTIVLKGSRLDLIQQSLDSHSRCPSVEDVVINFDGGTMEHNVPEFLLSHRTTNLGQMNDLDAKSLFLLNEGIILSCNEIEKAFKEWKRDPRRAVGFFGYHSADSTTGGPDVSSSGKLDGTTLVPSGIDAPYSMLSDRAMFIHPRYLDVLPISTPETSCCHLLLSMQVVAASSRAPLVVRSQPRKLLDIGTSYSGNNPYTISTPGIRSRQRQVNNHKPNECSNECVPRWLRPGDLDLLRQEESTILA